MASSTSSSSSSTKGFWSRIIVASPNPSQLQGGRQLEGAPMCPCHDCWEYGSHNLAPPKLPKAPKASKTPKAPKEKKSPLQIFKRANSSKESVASDLQPLKQSVTLVSAASSIHGGEY